MGPNECSQPASKSSWDSQDFGDVNMVLKMVHFDKSSRPQWVNVMYLPIFLRVVSFIWLPPVPWKKPWTIWIKIHQYKTSTKIKQSMKYMHISRGGGGGGGVVQVSCLWHVLLLLLNNQVLCCYGGANCFVQWCYELHCACRLSWSTDPGTLLLAWIINL